MTIVPVPISTHIGATITGATGPDLLRPEHVDAVRAALGQHLVLVFPGLGISDDDLVSFGRLLGEVVVFKTHEHRLPEIQTITMDPDVANERLIPYRQANFLWHIDGTHDAAPQKATLLSVQRLDEFGGGDTQFASTVAAYDALPEEDRIALEGLRVVHRFGASIERVFPDASDAERRAWDTLPAREHPLVWRHWSGRRALMIGCSADHVVGMDRDEGRALIDRLVEWSTQPHFTLRHQWQPGDLVIFDNTGVLHRAMPFEHHSHRLLHRITLVGQPSTA